MRDFYPSLSHNFFIHGHVGYFHVLAAVNTGVHVSSWITVFSGYMPSGGIAGSYSSFIPSFF